MRHQLVSASAWSDTNRCHCWRCWRSMSAAASRARRPMRSGRGLVPFWPACVRRIGWCSSPSTRRSAVWSTRASPASPAPCSMGSRERHDEPLRRALRRAQGPRAHGTRRAGPLHRRRGQLALVRRPISEALGRGVQRPDRTWSVSSQRRPTGLSPIRPGGTCWVRGPRARVRRPAETDRRGDRRALLEGRLPSRLEQAFLAVLEAMQMRRRRREAGTHEIRSFAAGALSGRFDD